MTERKPLSMRGSSGALWKWTARLAAFCGTSHGHIGAADPAFDRLLDLAPGFGGSVASVVISGTPPQPLVACLALQLRVAVRLNTADQLEAVPDDDNDADENDELGQTETEHRAI
jgi:hypothetical protein